MRVLFLYSFVVVTIASPCAADLPEEPLALGDGPQFVFDRHVIDNHWAIKYKREAVRRVYHQPLKHEANPLILGDGGYCCVVREPESGRFRMWYQTWTPSPVKGKSGTYAIAYAESPDGIEWTLPRLGRYEWKGSKDNNVVWRGRGGKRASSPFFLDVPEKDRRGYRYVMLYREHDGMHVIGSQDGIEWDGEHASRISRIHSDTCNAIVYDPERGEYVMYCRAKHIYRTFRGHVLDTGASRRVARMSNATLWDPWESEPQTLLVPDERDGTERFHFYYGMPTRHYGGVYWGFLWPFRMNDNIHTELAVSRDGFDFYRHPDRPKLIPRGEEGAWDDGMTFGSPRWVEVGDEWWIYYAGWDGPHGTKGRTPGIGLATIRKEGFISMRGPKNGGALCTRKIRWTGKRLLVNADASRGELKVRLTDAGRKPLEGFDYDDCVTLRGDGVSQEVRWRERRIGELAGEVIRMEFFLKDADLFTFRAE